MGSTLSTSETSPQFLGISFIQNYRFYFRGSKDVINTVDVAQTVKNAFSYHHIKSQISNLLKNADELNKKQILAELNTISKDCTEEPDISKLTSDLNRVKDQLSRLDSHQECIAQIRQLKHDKQTLTKQLEEAREQMTHLRSTLRLTRKHKDCLESEIDQLKTAIHKQKELINSLQQNISTKDKLLDSIISTLLETQQQLSLQASEIKTSINLINDIETLLSQAGTAFDILVARIQQLESNPVKS